MRRKSISPMTTIVSAAITAAISAGGTGVGDLKVYEYRLDGHDIALQADRDDIDTIKKSIREEYDSRNSRLALMETRVNRIDGEYLSRLDKIDKRMEDAALTMTTIRVDVAKIQAKLEEADRRRVP